jgi:type III secretion system FlhB-like substrate exporter
MQKESELFPFLWRLDAAIPRRMWAALAELLSLVQRGNNATQQLLPPHHDATTTYRSVKND